ncbi:PDDEXK family nuclease [Streptomyces litmocidini]|uniref:hypothetical protein n=1 Tax=Streptomyces litmocidini TaxID=67318 RepID=UPI00370332BC
MTEVTPWLAEAETDVQALVEGAMESMLGVRFLATEYSTGSVHGGRIDSLGLDENGSPVIVEYKRATDPGVLSQGLFYVAWLMDHREEFEALVRERLGLAAAAGILWSTPRLICVAGGFTRYDLHAVREHRRSIDLGRVSEVNPALGHSGAVNAEVDHGVLLSIAVFGSCLGGSRLGSGLYLVTGALRHLYERLVGRSAHWRAMCMRISLSVSTMRSPDRSTVTPCRVPVKRNGAW